jgi:hypothetical protein
VNTTGTSIRIGPVRAENRPPGAPVKAPALSFHPVYNDFYGFQESPFNLTPDPRFLFFSDKHREAFHHVLFGIRERKGFIQLTGEVGAGRRRSAGRCSPSSARATGRP